LMLTHSLPIHAFPCVCCQINRREMILESAAHSPTSWITSSPPCLLGK
jgi:hypothetical protein